MTIKQKNELIQLSNNIGEQLNNINNRIIKLEIELRESINRTELIIELAEKLEKYQNKNNSEIPF